MLYTLDGKIYNKKNIETFYDSSVIKLNINLENITPPFTFGQSLINIGVPYDIVTELYNENKWDNLNIENVLNILEKSNTYKNLSLVSEFYPNIKNKDIFDYIFKNTIQKIKIFKIKEDIMFYINDFKNKIKNIIDYDTFVFLSDNPLVNFDVYINTLIKGNINTFFSLSNQFFNKLSNNNNLQKMFDNIFNPFIISISELYIKLDQEINELNSLIDPTYLYNDSKIDKDVDDQYISTYKILPPITPNIYLNNNILSYDNIFVPAPAPAPAPAPVPAPAPAPVNDLILDFNTPTTPVPITLVTVYPYNI